MLAKKMLSGAGFSVGDDPSEKNKKRGIRQMSRHFEWVRFYSAKDYFPDYAHELGLKVAAECILERQAEKNEVYLAELIEIARAGHVDLAVIGNEALWRATWDKDPMELTPEKQIGYIKRFRAAVPHVPVTTGEIWHFILANPQIIEHCDIVGMHHYPFWDGVPIEHAIADFDEKYRKVKALAGDKEVWVLETGWPSAGNPKGDAIPSIENARRYFREFTRWAKRNNVKYFWFEAFDEKWKIQYEDVQGAHWGIWEKPGGKRKYRLR